MHARSFLPVLRSGKAVLLVVGLLAALLAAAIPAANKAHAAVPDRWGFAFLDNANPPKDYTPDPSRQSGSWGAGGAVVTVDQLGLGSYVVHFPQIGGAGGIAQATAVNAAGDWCQVDGWEEATPNEDVRVGCYSPDGSATNSEFTVVFTSSSGDLPPSSGQYAYLYSDVSGGLLAEYNSTGEGASVTKTSTGQWDAWLPGLGQDTPAGDIQVTAVNPTQGARCKVANWAPGATGQNVGVICFNADNQPFDTQWTLSYTFQRALFGGSFPPKSFGYLWFDGDLPPLTTFNSVGATNAVSESGAEQIAILPEVANTPDDAQVTAFGGDPGYCDIAKPWDRSGGNASVFINCFQPGGTPAPGPFFAAYTSAF